MTRLLQYEPWLVAAFGRQLDELTAALPYLSWITPARPGRWAPACEVFSRDGDLVVALDLPGIDPDKDVQVTVQDATLCISGERHRPGGADARTDGYRRPEGLCQVRAGLRPAAEAYRRGHHRELPRRRARGDRA